MRSRGIEDLTVGNRGYEEGGLERGFSRMQRIFADFWDDLFQCRTSTQNRECRTLILPISRIDADRKRGLIRV